MSGAVPRAGIGLRAPHLAAVAAERPTLGLLEVHAENYMGGGPRLAALEALRADYPLSVHGIGLSLGGADPPDPAHLARLRRLVERLEPALVSEHLAWCTEGGVYVSDLMPLPYTEETLALFVRHVEIAQEALGRRLLIENPSGYLRYGASTIPEAEFLAAVAARSGCGILCDVNNIWVTAQNLGLDPDGYLGALPAAAIGELHLAGHRANRLGRKRLLIDDHGSAVAPAVWALYRKALRRFGAVPTIVEWDVALPSLERLLGEAAAADTIARECLEPAS